MTRLLGWRGAAALGATLLSLAGGSNAAVQGQTQPVAAPSAVLPALSLAGLVEANKIGEALDEQAQCLATAVYFEARGEPLEGQLAVANVVMNRAASGRYPSDWCSVVKQPWQFSFVNPRSGRFPRIDAASEAWARAVAVSRIAAKKLAAEVPQDVLWYHADYVAPSWGRRLSRVNKIGAHIFYRA